MKRQEWNSAATRAVMHCQEEILKYKTPVPYVCSTSGFRRVATTKNLTRLEKCKSDPIRFWVHHLPASWSRSCCSALGLWSGHASWLRSWGLTNIAMETFSRCYYTTHRTFWLTIDQPSDYTNYYYTFLHTSALVTTTFVLISLD